MDSQTILVVDDQPDILENISFALEGAGFKVLQAMDGSRALEFLEQEPIHLILSDIAMPHLNGYQLLEKVRENPEWVMIPFLFLTVRGLNSDIRYGKELGVDDYLTKPIEIEDLLAAVRGKLKRMSQLHIKRTLLPMPDVMIELGDLKIDTVNYRVWQNEQPIKLSVKEFRLLEYLARRLGQLVPVEELTEVTHEFKTDKIEAGNLLRPVVRNLRRKLGHQVGEMGLIENVRGLGYRIV